MAGSVASPTAAGKTRNEQRQAGNRATPVLSLSKEMALPQTAASGTLAPLFEAVATERDPPSIRVHSRPFAVTGWRGQIKNEPGIGYRFVTEE